MEIKKPAFLVGLIGHHIAASLAPEIHMREGERQGVRYVYRLLDLSPPGADVNGLETVLRSAERLGYNGLAVTHPFKQSVVPLLDELSEEALVLNSVNTIFFDRSRMIGHNTDWYGFHEAFEAELPAADRRRVVKVGAGGAGGAVAYGGLQRGIEELVLFDLDPERARRVVEDLSRVVGPGRLRVGTDLGFELDRASGLINASPVGMTAHPGLPIPPASLRRDFWIADIIYFPWETELVRLARARGAETMNGGIMAVYQAARQFKLFTGRDLDVAAMLGHLKRLASSSN